MERLIVALVVLGNAVEFGLCCAVEGEVGDDAFVPTFGGVVCDDVGRGAQALNDGAGPMPGSDVFGSAAGLHELSLR